MLHHDYGTVSILAILISFSFLSFSIPSCDANYASWGTLNEGAAFHKGAHISMPYADVRINITRTTSSIEVSMDSEFHIKTNITQNATLAFVYPSISEIYQLSNSPNDNGGSDSIDASDYMRIYANATLMDYSVINSQNFTESTSEDYWEDYSFIQYYVNFAVFDIELTANTTMVLSTVSNLVFDANMERFDYFYIVGSARTFEGHTLERVHIQVVEEVPFLTKDFSPIESLTLVENELTTDAIWEFNITEFSEDTVGLEADVMRSAYDWRILIGSIAFPIIVVFLVYQFGYKKSKEFKQE